MSEIFREITPLTQFDCFTIVSRAKTDFDFPLHSHEEFELNFLLNAAGAQRIIGDHTEVIEDIELVLVGSNLPHSWQSHDFKHTEGQPKILEVTIQFHRDLFDSNFLRRNQLYFIKNLFENSSKGIVFPKEVAEKLKPRIISLNKMTGFDSVLELFSILHELSLSRGIRLLSSESYSDDIPTYNSRRIQAVMEYMRNHYKDEVTLANVAKIAGMTEVSFSRFFKKNTNKTFVESLNEIRLSNASRMLMDSSESIAEIAFKSGFNNLSYFNRIFKDRKNVTPKEFREIYAGTRTFI